MHLFSYGLNTGRRKKTKIATIIPIVNEASKTRMVEEFDNSRIASVIKIGIQIAIVKASIVLIIIQAGFLNITLNNTGLKERWIGVVGNAIRIIKISTKFIIKKGENAQYIILNLCDWVWLRVPPL